jgi:iron complex outermembrane receptor protein
MKNRTFLFGWLTALLALGGSADLTAQLAPTAPSASDQPQQNEQIVKMSAFEVLTTQGTGYVATTAAMGFKTHDSEMDIPQGDIVITSDFIRDLGYENASDVAQYFGVMQNIEGACMQMRGTSVLNYPYIDDIPTGELYHDTVQVDSYELIKGPVQSLYIDAGLGGLVIEVTKKPLPFQQDILTASLTQTGVYRFTVDSTGPIGKVGDFELSYRLCAAYEHGNLYFANTYDSRYAIFPELGIKYKNTTVRLYWDQQSVNGPYGMGFLTPTGQMESGMGWKYENQISPGMEPQSWQGHTLYAEILQKISDNWESRLSAMDWRYDLDDAGEYAASVDYDNNTETWADDRGDEHWNFWTLLDDYQGHYQLGPENWSMKNSDIFGFAYQATTDKQFYYYTAPFPWPNGPIGGTVTVPFNDPAVLDAIRVPPPNDISPPTPANWAAQSYAHDIQTQNSAIYWQHTIDLVPNWFTIVAGETWDNVATQSVANWAVLPWTGTNFSASEWTHRFAAVLHLTKSVSLYALDATNFTVSLVDVTLENGDEPPPQVGTGTELGIKWNFLNGKITGEASWFKLITDNALNLTAGLTPSGAIYAAVIGTTTGEGVDGDAAFSIVPGWQLIGSWYAGHEVDPFGHEVPSSFNNSLSFFTSYSFPADSFLRGLTIGGGLTRVGGRWVAAGAAVGMISSTINIPPVIKVQTGTLGNAFVAYKVNKHWGLKVSVSNVLNENFPLGFETTPLYVDPSQPRDFTFATSYKF